MLDINTPWMVKLVLTSAAAAAAESCTYPIDFVKTRLQLQGELASSGPHQGRRVGALQLAKHVISSEGPLALYSGLSPALVRHVFYTGTRISVYEQLREWWKQQQEQQQQAGQGQVHSIAAAAAAPGLAVKLAMGLTAGAAGQLVAVPADLVKVRMQADGRLVAAGLQPSPRYKGMVHALRSIVGREGVAGLWRGASPAVQRAALVNLGELATYDQAKQWLLGTGVLPDGLLLHAAASVCSGFFASLMSTPADVIKTRVMNQDAAKPLYRGSLDCLVQSVRAEGLLALYKGLLPTWARLGPWQLTFWVSYEHLRTTCDIQAF